MYRDISQLTTGVLKGWKVLIALVNQVLNQLTLQITFTLIALGNLPFWAVFIQDDEIIGLSN